MVIDVRNADLAPTKSVPPRLGWQGGVIVAMAVAAFGPYISGSIRTEQAVVYLAALLLIPAFVRLHPPRAGVVALLGLVGVLMIALFGEVIPAVPSDQFLAGKSVAGIDNLALPIAVLAVVWMLIKARDADNVLRSAGKLIAWFAAGNAVLAVISTRTDVTQELRPFWAKEDASGALTVADRAAQLGRFSGIFNQPAEAGVVYGLAALLAIYCYKERRTVMLLLLTLILIGGLLSVSKTFILCGLPVALFYLWRSNPLGGRLGMVYTLPILGLGVAQAGIFQNWSGSNFLGRLLSPPENQSLVEFYSSGRFDSTTSNVSGVASAVMSASPLSGVGAHGWEVAYDSGMTEVIVVGGLIGVAFHAITFIGLWIIGRRTVDRDRRLLAQSLCVFLIGADLGLPALTANRAATVVWITVALLALATQADSDRRVSRGPGGILPD